MDIPNLSPAVAIPGLPTDTQARLHQLVTAMAYGPMNYLYRPYFRYECENQVKSFLQISTFHMERDYLQDLLAADTAEKRDALMVDQDIRRSMIVANVLNLHEMFAIRGMHARALAEELLAMNSSLVDLADDNELVVLVANLAGLAREHLVDPQARALKEIDRVPELYPTRAFKAVRDIFEKVRGRQEMELGVKIGPRLPFIDIHNARGAHLDLLSALREEKAVREAWRDAVHAPELDICRQRVQHIAMLEKAQDQSAFEKEKNEFKEAEVGFVAAAANLTACHIALKKAGRYLKDALAPACDAIYLQGEFSFANDAAVANLKVALNCIAAFGLIADIEAESQRYHKMIAPLSQLRVGSKNYIDTALKEVMARTPHS